MLKVNPVEKFLTELSEDILFIGFVSILFNEGFLRLIRPLESYLAFDLIFYAISSLWFIILSLCFVRVTRRRQSYGFRYLIFLNVVMKVLFLLIHSVFSLPTEEDIYAAAGDGAFSMAAAFLGYFLARKVDFDIVKEKFWGLF